MTKERLHNNEGLKGCKDLLKKGKQNRLRWWVGVGMGKEEVNWGGTKYRKKWPEIGVISGVRWKPSAMETPQN